MRHVAAILPSARALFTPLNRALQMTPHTIALSATGEVRAAPLLDLQQLFVTLSIRPTHVNEILPASEPDYIGYCDASAFGWQLHRDANEFRPGDGGGGVTA
jgi:hypothetical protein